MNELIEIAQRLERIEAMLKNKSFDNRNDQWVGVTVITKATGWDNEDLRKARRNGSIKFKVKTEGTKRTYRYLLSSIIK